MAARRSPPLPAASLSPVSRAFSRWRSSHGRGSRIPDELWDDAARLAAEHGVNPVANALRLNYYALKERVESLGALGTADLPAGSSANAPADPTSTFVEIPMAPEQLAEREPMEVEVESPGGWKLRVRTQAGEDLDVAGMLEVLGGLAG